MHFNSIKIIIILISNSKLVHSYLDCLIETSCYGCNDASTSNAYIAFNDDIIFNNILNGAGSGFTLVELNVSSCSSTNVVTFGTSGSIVAANNMVTYINSRPLNTVLIGITTCDAKQSLIQNATSALLTIGVNVTGLQYLGKASFVAQVGQPAIAVSQIASPTGGNLKLKVEVSGSYHSITFVRQLPYLQKWLRCNS